MLRQVPPKRKTKLLKRLIILFILNISLFLLKFQHLKTLSLAIILHTMSHEPEVKATDMEEEMIKKVKEIAMNAVKDYKQEK